MLRTPSRGLRHAVGAIKIAVATTVTVLAAGPALGSVPAASSGPDRAEAAFAALQAEYDALMAAHDCSAAGFATGVVAGSALVQRDGRVVRVSFDEGWAVHHGESAGSLLAVCRDVL